MHDLRQFFGALLGMVGLALLIAPVFMLDSSTSATGTDRANVAILVEALGAISGGVVSLIFAWFLLRRK